MSPAKKDLPITIGGAPRVDLLPPEIRAERRGAAVVRRAWMGVAVAVAAVVIATAASSLGAAEAQADLEAAQGETQSLLSQQASYSDVKEVKTQVELLTAAERVGGSTDIDWPAYLAQVQATLPVGVSITSVSLDQASPFVQYPQATAALQGARVATLTFEATSPTLPSVPQWLDGLATLPGYADAQPGSVSLEEGVYTANITMHVNEAAFSGRYTDEEGE